MNTSFKIVLILLLIELCKSHTIYLTCANAVIQQNELTEISHHTTKNESATFPILIDFNDCDIEKINSDVFNLCCNNIITAIYLSANNIDELDLNTFANNQNLKILHLDYNWIKILNDGIFNSLTNLTELFLDNNKIQYIHKSAFWNMYSLRILNLSNNNLKSLDKFLFLYVPNLAFLNLASNSISYLDKNIFVTLRRLERLSLNNNNIFNVHKNLFQSLHKLKYLELSNNNILKLDPQTLSNKNNGKLIKVWINYIKIENIPEDLYQMYNLTFKNSKSKKSIQFDSGNNVTIFCNVKNEETLNNVYWFWITNTNTYGPEYFEIWKEKYLITQNEDACSLIIFNASKSDEGTYKCLTDEEEPLETNTELIIRSNELHDSSEELVSEVNVYMTISILFSIIIILLIAIIVIIYIKFKIRYSHKDNKHQTIIQVSQSVQGIGRQDNNGDNQSESSYAYVYPNAIPNYTNTKDDPRFARDFSLLERNSAARNRIQTEVRYSTREEINEGRPLSKKESNLEPRVLKTARDNNFGQCDS